ncbi:hypothetical protein T439DRAFT_312194 [Meredithblackwellia eburnea MCA 4105]
MAEARNGATDSEAGPPGIMGQDDAIGGEGEQNLLSELDSHLLPFQRHILSLLVPSSLSSSPATGNALVVLARGLGLRGIISTLLKIYQSDNHLVLVVNATQEEERGLTEEVGLKFKLVSYEMASQARQALYKSGGLLSVTSRILVVDMLNGIIPVDLITGLVIMHAELVTPTSLEAFVVRIFRQRNKTGFIKAFSDSPEGFTTGMTPLQTILQQLHIREAHIFPRFHETVAQDLVKRKADVLELYQPMTERMKEIQTAVIECMEATLSEIKKSNTYLEVEDLTVENALFRSFDALVRRQLDPVWHKVGPKTKGLVSDLTTLRKIQAYLIELDSVSFNRFLETIIIAQETTKGGYENKNKSPWLFTPAADTILNVAKDRVFRKIEVGSVLGNGKGKGPLSNGVGNAILGGGNGQGKGKKKEVIKEEEEEEFPDEWDGPTEEEEEALRVIELEALGVIPAQENAKGEERQVEHHEEVDEATKLRRHLDKMLPEGIESVLEEQPKWALLAEVLDEIEQQLYWSPVDPGGLSNDTILIMTNAAETCSTLRQYLANLTSGTGAQEMLHRKLRSYFHWKADMSKMQKNLFHHRQKHGKDIAPVAGNSTLLGGGKKTGAVFATADGFENAAMKRKREWKAGQAPSNKRRRVRGGGAVGSQVGEGHSSPQASSSATTPSSVVKGAMEQLKAIAASGLEGEELIAEANAIADFITAANMEQSEGALPLEPPSDAPFNEAAFTEYFGLLANEDLAIIRPYMDDEDDKVLDELRPKFIVLYDPTPAFVRRIEAYRAAHPRLSIRVYFLMYKDSVEEQRYLSTIRKEKDAFERLIREKGVMAIPHEAEYRPGDEESATLRTINSRIAGGSRQVRTEPPKVVVDVREFRSSLPSLLHAGSFDVVPTTLSIGDYIITPEMCVERKAIPDLIQSFNSGRLYQQCEQMTAHYKEPILLIEFDEKKSFNLEQTYTTEGKGPPKADAPSNEVDLRSKIVLLTITFPRLRIIWSSSPYQTVEIFRDLKENRDEPDSEVAANVGVEDATGATVTTGVGEAGMSFMPQEMLRTLPGITTANYRYVMSKVDNFEALCKLPLEKIQEYIGVENGRVLHRFVTRDVTNEDLLDMM